MITLELLMTDLPPLNAMPSGKNLNKVAMAAKIGSHIPNPTVQTVSRAASLALDLAKKSEKRGTTLNVNTSSLSRPSLK